MRWYEAVKSFVTKRIVYFPALGVAVFTAILLAVIVRQPLFELAAVFVTVTAVLITTHVTRGRAPDKEAVFKEMPEPPNASKRVAKILHPNPKVEKYQWEGREHILSLLDFRPGWEWMKRALDSWKMWRLWFPGLCCLVILVVAFGVTHNVVVALLVLVLVGIALRIAEWRRRYLVFTSIRFIAIRGVGTTRKLQVPLEAMTGHSIKVPWHSKTLKALGLIKACYGTLEISAPGEHNAELNQTPWMPDIYSIDLHLTDLIYARKQALSGKPKTDEKE
jgi:hypothetical protein